VICQAVVVVMNMSCHKVCPGSACIRGMYWCSCMPA
jgi:hypothetical protein